MEVKRSQLEESLLENVVFGRHIEVMKRKQFLQLPKSLIDLIPNLGGEAFDENEWYLTKRNFPQPQPEGKLIDFNYGLTNPYKSEERAVFVGSERVVKFYPIIKVQP